LVNNLRTVERRMPMTGQAIIKHIDTVLSSSTANDALDARLEQFAVDHSIILGPNDKAAMAELAEGYIRTVANLLIASDIAATAAGIQRFTAPIIQTAAEYFLRPKDYIPDDEGLYGLLDDAYLACRFIVRISEIIAAERGVALIDTSLDRHSPTIRVLIGEPLATRLDNDVEDVIQAVISQIQMEQIQALQFRYNWNQWAHQENVINTEAQIMSIASGSY
jgi:uncharacterized membrane protein YkvA (DUF1232 family)